MSFLLFCFDLLLSLARLDCSVDLSDYLASLWKLLFARWTPTQPIPHRLLTIQYDIERATLTYRCGNFYAASTIVFLQRSRECACIATVYLSRLAVLDVDIVCD